MKKKSDFVEERGSNVDLEKLWQDFVSAIKLKDEKKISAATDKLILGGFFNSEQVTKLLPELSLQELDSAHKYIRRLSYYSTRDMFNQVRSIDGGNIEGENLQKKVINSIIENELKENLHKAIEDERSHSKYLYPTLTFKDISSLEDGYITPENIALAALKLENIKIDERKKC